MVRSLRRSKVPLSLSQSLQSSRSWQQRQSLVWGTDNVNDVVRSKLSLPTPKLLDWSDDPANPIGTEYIIQEHVEGVQLHQVWPDMNSEQHMLCSKALSLAIKQMASLDFPAYGSLYFSDAPLEEQTKIPLEQGFCVGPNCSPVFWNRNPGELELYGGPSPNCGPWRDLTSYCTGLIETGFYRLPKEEHAKCSLPHQGAIQDHVQLLNISQEVMQRLIEDKRIQDAAAPALVHPDFHKRNIYVSAEDPTVITGIIDWQSTSIEPSFIYANETPDFATPPQDIEGDIFENREGESTPVQTEKERKDASICYQTYDVCMKGLTPKLRPTRLLDPTLFRLFHYTHTTWRDSATAIRQELIELSDRWSELGLHGTCPFSLTDEERNKHAKDYEDFEAVQSLKLWLKRSLNTNSDGWVPNEAWDAARDAHRAAYDYWIQTAREYEDRGEDGMTVEKAERLWPFDAR
ncbi:serine/threonine protein kinase [Aspergillus luchuensis]|uniref:Altered inheritance of mitochondria protein 9, mitochondrial n=1 Tax=Aspergillus kawachii TaxID=1069201 RepID=A0A146FLF1_ASPKA|nr:serine/threonine protein kinase [Aspergillus luchuensis]